jgi:prolyl oligopeptidase
MITIASSCRVLALLLGVAGPFTSQSFADPPFVTEPLDYPLYPRGPQVDKFHSQDVADPYRGLEDGTSQQTKDWLAAQQKLSYEYLKGLPHRQKLHTRLKALWNYARRSAPVPHGNRWLYSYNNGTQNQPIVYITGTVGDSVLLNPNRVADDGTVSVPTYSLSRDGNYVAYATSEAGSDWRELRVKDVRSGGTFADRLRWVKFTGINWFGNGHGFYYCRFPEPAADKVFSERNVNQKIYYHQVGTDQSQDVLVYERPDHEEWTFSTSVVADRYLLIHVHDPAAEGTRLFYKDVLQPSSRVVEVLGEGKHRYSYIGSDGTRLFLVTNDNAPRGRVVMLDIGLTKPTMKDVVSQASETLEDATISGAHLVLSYLKNAGSQVMVYDLQGSFLRQIALPEMGTANSFSAGRGSTMYFSFTNYLTPTTVYSCDLSTGKTSIYFKPKVDFDPGKYETQQVFYKSKDGTQVSMFITCKKGIKRDGQNHTILYGYGGFNSSLTPTFSISSLAWMETGGIVAVPNLRGGGEYGEDWYKAGCKLKKQNVFDDFIAAAEWLIANDYTSSAKLAINGGSNGGLLVGACMTQRPELFAAAVPEVGVLDMTRYQHFTIGRSWVKDYGTTANADEFKALIAYSPYHNVTQGTVYPATLVMTGDHDDRVVPAHSFKFAAALQHAQGGDAPVLLRVGERMGHGAGTPQSKWIDDSADKLSFLLQALHVEVP